MLIQAYLYAINDKLYGDSTITKIWELHPLIWVSRNHQLNVVDTQRSMSTIVQFFFTGSLYASLERNDNFPSKKINPVKLAYAVGWWAEPLVAKNTKTDNLDLGFIIMPPFEQEYDHSGKKSPKTPSSLRQNLLSSGLTRNLYQKLR